LPAVQAMGWLLLAWLAINVLPGRFYRRMMRPSVRKREMKDAERNEMMKRVRWAVRAAAKRVPWKAVCFHQGIAAQQMLCRAGIPAELHYGVAKSDDKGLEAHVWVMANGNTVVGGATQDRFTVLAIFEGVTQSPSVE